MPCWRAECGPRVVVRVFPEVAAAAVSRVEPAATTRVELPRRPDQLLVGDARIEVLDKQLARRRAHRDGGEELAVGVEVGVDERADQVAVP